ncbi:MAG: hypothetical protein ABUS79_00840 [Pseudomonadota bacterium]
MRRTFTGNPCRVSSRRAGAVAVAGLACGVALGAAPAALALDKQGSAHGGAVGGQDTGFAVSGTLSAGVSPYNPTYAARPDNSGHALMRYAAHLDVDLLGRRLSVPLDVNFLSDRDRGGGRALLPSELDLITGLTSTWEAGSGAVEVGARVEHDRAIDRTAAAQTYADVRARYLFASGDRFPAVSAALGGGGFAGHVTLGWFAYNKNYFARPENTGLALFRYTLHFEVSAWHDRLALGVDGTFFTDRRASNVVRPSELDLTPALIARFRSVEAQLAYERDMPLDRGGLVQHFVYLLVGWNFSLPW